MAIFKKFLPLFCPLAVLIIYAILFSCNNIYPFGDNTISWGDMDQQTIPLLCCFKDVLDGKSSFWLSLQNAGGINFFGVYFFYLSSPFTYLVAFFPKEMMPCAVNIMVVLKLALASLTMSIYLRYTVKKANAFIIMFLSILYAFCGFAMMYYQILSWLDTLYVFPLLLLGLEKIKEGKSSLLYVFSLFACMLFHFYLGYAVVVFLCLYGATYLLFNRDKKDNFVKNFLISSAISAMLSAVVLVPCFLQYLSSMRMGNIFESLNSRSFFPPFQTSLPSFSCLIIVAPFIIKNKEKFKLDQQSLLFILTLVPAFIEPIAMAWQTFNYMCFPTRYSFITVALGISLALKGITAVTENLKDGENIFTKLDKNTCLKAFLSLFGVAFCIAFATFSYRFYIDNKQVITAYSQTLWGNDSSFEKLLIYYLIPALFITLFYLASKYKLVHKIAVYAVIGALCITEAFFSANLYMTKPSNDYKEFKQASQLENLIEDNDFYRVKSYAKHYDVNLVGAFGYNTLSHFTSLNAHSFVMMMKEMGYSSYWLEVHSNGGTIFTDALLNNKYTIYRGKNSSALYSTENFYIKQNDYLFPSAFLIDTKGSNESDQNLERWEIQNSLFKRLTNMDDLYKKYNYTSLAKVKDNSNDNSFIFNIEHDEISNENDYATITYQIKVNEKESFYFDYFNAYSNALREPTNEDILQIYLKSSLISPFASVVKNWPAQMNNGTLYLGTFEHTIITVQIKLNRDILGKSFGVYSVNNKKLESAINSVIGGDIAINKSGLSGKIGADSGQSLFTCLPFDDGYKATVNGKKAKTFSVNGLLAIELENGECQIEVTYLPKGVYLGMAICLLGVVALAVYLVFNKKINEFKKFDRFFEILAFALGVAVILVIYLMPVVVNIL